ncbi:hypothetical protein TWF730_010612 [Orbilia blumenaviensis]|uniref:Uncharacterized protein n=1 Tax=Orbilia blumenaviensis TaxID=1796055 RepID=A0AAV9US72_9PEZI
MNTLLKALVLSTLVASAAAQSSVECAAIEADLPTTCPATYNPCCKYICKGVSGDPVCKDIDIASGSPDITCEACPGAPDPSATDGEADPPAETEPAVVSDPPAETIASATAGYGSDPPAASTEPPASGSASSSTAVAPPPVYTPAGNGTATTLEPIPTNSNGTTSALPIPTGYDSGAHMHTSSVLTISGSAIVGVLCLMVMLM